MIGNIGASAVRCLPDSPWFVRVWCELLWLKSDSSPRLASRLRLAVILSSRSKMSAGLWTWTWTNREAFKDVWFADPQNSSDAASPTILDIWETIGFTWIFDRFLSKKGLRKDALFIYAALVASEAPVSVALLMPWHQLPVTMPRLWHQVRHCPYRECYAACVALSPMPRLWHPLHVSECSLSVLVVL